MSGRVRLQPTRFPFVIGLADRFPIRVFDPYFAIAKLEQIEAIDGNHVVSRHAGVVGKLDRPTPVLKSAVHELNFNPVWRLPLWEPYDRLLDGKISTLCNVSSGPFAGSITAALFLRRFIERTRSWAHFDIYGWNPSTKPARPEGGDAQTARLLYGLLEARYGKK